MPPDGQIALAWRSERPRFVTSPLPLHAVCFELSRVAAPYLAPPPTIHLKRCFAMKTVRSCADTWSIPDGADKFNAVSRVQLRRLRCTPRRNILHPSRISVR